MEQYIKIKIEQFLLNIHLLKRNSDNMENFEEISSVNAYNYIYRKFNK